jgi:hypothetical protein
LLSSSEFETNNKNPGLPLQKLHSTRTSTMDLNLRKKLVKWYIWRMALCGAETWMLQAADQKQMESFEMWCWRGM